MPRAIWSAARIVKITSRLSGVAYKPECGFSPASIVRILYPKGKIDTERNSRFVLANTTGWQPHPTIVPKDASGLMLAIRSFSKRTGTTGADTPMMISVLPDSRAEGEERAGLPLRLVLTTGKTGP